MFEASILFVLLGLILWFILAKKQTIPARRAHHIDLVAELKPAAKKANKSLRP